MKKLLIIIASLALLTACGQKAPVKTEAETKADNAKMIRDNPVYGDQIKSMDKAKAVSEAASKADEDRLKKAE